MVDLTVIIILAAAFLFLLAFVHISAFLIRSTSFIVTFFLVVLVGEKCLHPFVSLIANILHRDVFVVLIATFHVLFLIIHIFLLLLLFGPFLLLFLLTTFHSSIVALVIRVSHSTSILGFLVLDRILTHQK
jgi:hypothetical protein